jgi:transcriptional regulator with XRE-family HTH domain
VKKDLPTVFGEVLKSYREFRGLSQQALADYAEMDRAYISKLERGISVPSVVTVFKLADILKIKPQEFIQKIDKGFSR